MGIEAELKFKIPDRPVALGLTVGQTVPLAATGSEGSGRRLDVYDHIHAEFIFRIAPIAAAQRNSLIGRPGYRHPDQVSISDDPIGRIELNPARARQVNRSRPQAVSARLGRARRCIL